MFKSKEEKELIKKMSELLDGKLDEFYMVVLLEGQDFPDIITSGMLSKPFSSFIDTRYTYLWNKKLKRILGVAKTKEQAEQIKTYYKYDNHKDFYYVVYGEYPHIGIDKREYVAEDSYNYCLRTETGNLCLVEKSNCFETFEKAVEKQNQKIQEKDRKSLSTSMYPTYNPDIDKFIISDNKIKTTSVPGTTTFSCSCKNKHKNK